MTQFVTEPTRIGKSGCENILDLVFSNSDVANSDINVIASFSNSDHCTIKFAVNVSVSEGAAPDDTNYQTPD